MTDSQSLQSPSSSSHPRPAHALELPAGALRTRVASINDLLYALEEDLSVENMAATKAVMERVSARDSLDPFSVIVALVGATGSGKSSIFNAVAGAQLAATDVIRPTTRLPLAALSPIDEDDAGALGDREGIGIDALLDWTGVTQRVEIPEPGRLPAGVCLIDVPDIDSVDRSNGELARRLHERVDIVVWVVDPQKYADAIIHNEWIAPMASRAQSVIVVLNQVDRLTVDERETVRASLTRLLHEDGLDTPVIVETSALTGEGIAELVAQLGERAQRVRDDAVTLHADLDALRAQLRQELDLGHGAPGKNGAAGAWQPAQQGRDVHESLGRALAESEAVDGVAKAVRAAYRHRQVKTCGWLPLRWLGSLRIDPLKRLHLSGDGRQESLTHVDMARLMGPSGVSVALRHAVEGFAAGRPEIWATRIRRIARDRAENLTNAVQRGIARTDLGMGVTPSWWKAADLLQWLAWLVAIVGGGWLAVIHLVKHFLLVDIGAPQWGIVPVPTWLLAGGVTVSLVIAILAGIAGRIGARRRGAVARGRLRRSVAEVAKDYIGEPLMAEHARQAAVVEALVGE